MTEKEETGVTAKSVAVVKRELRKMDGGNEPPDTAVVLMSAAIVGAKLTPLERFTHLSRDTVRQCLHRGRANGIFTRDGRLAVEWADGGDGSGVAFWMDVCVLEGWMARSPE